MAVIKVSEADLLTNSSSSSAADRQQQQQPSTTPGQPNLHGLAGSPVMSALKQMRSAAAEVKAGLRHGQRNGQTRLTGSQNAGLHPRWLQMPAAAAAAAGVALVIDGAALALALQPQHEDELLALCKECSAVICCRVSPMQKAQVHHPTLFVMAETAHFTDFACHLSCVITFVSDLDFELQNFWSYRTAEDVESGFGVMKDLGSGVTTTKG